MTLAALAEEMGARTKALGSGTIFCIRPVKMQVVVATTEAL